MKAKHHQKGRGAQKNIPIKYASSHHEMLDDFLEYCRLEGENSSQDKKTKFIPVYPKTIINKVNSIDVGMAYSMNPYQGCEHGCVYCYARNTHEYWGYSAGKEFENTILVKKDAPKLLETKLRSPSWKAATIVLSGNTDCYQPAEKKYKITRSCLALFLKYRHPVAIITKNSLLLRDLDLLCELQKHRLIGVHISLTSLEEETRRLLEPRTTSVTKRLQTIQVLTQNNIPVHVMLAPIIPGINSHEILNMAKAVSDRGALGISHTIVRLNGAISEVFSDWLYKTMPNKAEKVLRQIKEAHGGTLNDSRIGTRLHGEGSFSKQASKMMQVARSRYFSQKGYTKLNTCLHASYKTGQLSLF